MSAALDPDYTTLDQAIEDYTYATLDLSPETQRWYRERLRHFRDWATRQQLTLQTLTAADLRRYKEPQQGISVRGTHRTNMEDQH